MVVFPATVREQRLRAFVRTAATVRLYVNNVLPTRDTVAADFEEPGADTGYQPIHFLKAMWRLEVAGPAIRAIASPFRFTFTSGTAHIQGVYVLDADGDLMWSERFTDPQGQYVPFDVLRAGDALEIKVMIDSLDLGDETLETAE
jgi:hypothetical protein